MGTPMTPQFHPANQHATWVPIDYNPAASAGGGGYNPSYANHSATAPNPYIQVSPVPGSTNKRTNETICKVMDRCGKKLEDSTKKAGDLVSNVWHHRGGAVKPSQGGQSLLQLLGEIHSDRHFRQPRVLVHGFCIL
ncbi:GEM-like protein 2 [Platanthera zijinensis]|uniref:GEM-like protein 2 n=1 Tax=Platanthera zijinensis TaxID=2320716 RepID=A0AAP0G9F9_9ASPA